MHTWVGGTQIILWYYACRENCPERNSQLSSQWLILSSHWIILSSYLPKLSCCGKILSCFWFEPVLSLNQHCPLIEYWCPAFNLYLSWFWQSWTYVFLAHRCTLTPVFLHKYMVKISSEYLITTCFFGCIVFKVDDCIEFLLIYFELKEEWADTRHQVNTSRVIFTI